MARREGKKEFKLQPGGLNAKVPQKFQDRNLLPVKPQTEQFEPTVGCPVRMRNHMAGGA